jgi:hypothetical protein
MTISQPSDYDFRVKDPVELSNLEPDELFKLKSVFVRGFALHECDPDNDFALLKLDLSGDSARYWLGNRTEVLFLRVSTRRISEGEPVYSYGFPFTKEPFQNKLLNSPQPA